MVGFSIKKVNSLTLGEKLKEIREDSGVSLSEIAKATKVRKQYLEKIEEGRYDELPPEVYVKGFLKSYAKYLDIEVKDVIKLYEKEIGIQRNIKKHKSSKNGHKKFSKIPSIVITPKFLAICIFVFLALAGFGYFYKEIGKFSQAPRLVIMEPSGDATVESSSIDIVGLTDGDSKITINGQAVLVDDEGNFNEQISLSEGINEMEIESINHFGNKTAKKIRISANFESQIAENDGGFVMGVQDENIPDKVYLGVKVIDSPTWVAIEVDGSLAQSGTMLPGSIQFFEGQEKVSVTSGKANKTIITLNEEELGPLGEDAGVIRDVIFTKETKIIPEPSVVDPGDQEYDHEQEKDDRKP